MSQIQAALQRVNQEIGRAIVEAGRATSDVELIAVSKSHPPSAVQEAIDAGHLLFGESRIQEAKAKIPALSARARWHFIGHLQKNKIRQALPLFDLFHGIDSLELARDMNRVAKELGLFPRILLEVNVATEPTKFGFAPDDVRRDLVEILKLDRIQVDGLMTIAPVADKPDASLRFFSMLHDLRDELQAAAGVPLKHLSMGMSQDYPGAIKAGATLVRVGTAIFGER